MQPHLLLVLLQHDIPISMLNVLTDKGQHAKSLLSTLSNYDATSRELHLGSVVEF